MARAAGRAVDRSTETTSRRARSANSSVTSWRSMSLRIVNGPRTIDTATSRSRSRRDLAAELRQLEDRAGGTTPLLVLALEQRPQLGVAIACRDQHREQLGELAVRGRVPLLVEQDREVLEEVAGVGRGDGLEAAAGGLHDHGLLRAEVAVQRGLGHAGAGGHVVERDRLDAAVEHEVDRGGQRGLTGLFAAGSSHGLDRSGTRSQLRCDRFHTDSTADSWGSPLRSFRIATVAKLPPPWSSRCPQPPPHHPSSWKSRRSTP